MVKPIFLKAQASSLVATAIDYTATVLWVECFNWAALFAGAFGTIIGGMVNFVIGRHWVFEAQKGELNKQLFKYLLVWMGSFILNIAGFAFMVELLGCNYFFSKVLVSVLVGIFYNYCLQMKYVFK